MVARIVGPKRNLGRGTRFAVRVRGFHQSEWRSDRGVLSRALPAFSAFADAARRSRNVGHLRGNRGRSAAAGGQHAHADVDAVSRTVDSGAIGGTRAGVSGEG